ncbi:MAG: DUF1499 domain-containing protein [Rhizobiales bacterium]|nr:DUF1499 domain-containing protein [Hyphomicrobiales bacterium]MBO6697451.1 DUF1499 domain-containing protein [Hyphomicrobiales bacterium]MBO6736294.1 DUF1499 domain-containing protein [Hyphomicrobiales bacterium]MBO6912764.1 DUF1499 domain-containing protein [Hyphomicrobiales bacterium]MBO6953933.1 DUF1499 domain-containing protein [Hyphomicrobiales bacterium]
MRLLAWIVAILVVAVAAFFVVGPGRVWQQIAGDPDTGPQSLETLERTGAPNDALLGPQDALAVAPDGSTPVFQVPPAELFATLLARIEETNEIRWVERDDDRLYAHGITASPTLQFPDINHIWVLPVATEDGEEPRSTLALYAAAHLGQSDHGKNRERLDRWLTLLDDLPRAD